MGNQMGCRPWSDLPVDVLNLTLDDFLRASIKFTFDATTQLFSFHIPSPNNQCRITKYIVEEELELFGAEICASKYGWLLLQQSDKAFFYSAFSRKAIKLPNMEIDFNRATFSSSPTSPDCICFAIQSSKSSDKIRFSICSPGNLEWCTIEVDGFNKAVEDVVYSNGNFYCVFSGGLLGAFDVASCDCSVLTYTVPIIRMQILSRSCLVESNGELLLVLCSTNFHVYKFGRSKMGWREIHELGNQALFLGCTSFAAAAEGNTSALADRVYYHGNGHRSCFYDLHTKERYACEDFYPWVLHDATERIWIQPPYFHLL
ncbi:hypothetical protein PTKIN_Ptkin06aG0148200 [Pterospermum kingtungense]